MSAKMMQEQKWSGLIFSTLERVAYQSGTYIPAGSWAEVQSVATTLPEGQILKNVGEEPVVLTAILKTLGRDLTFPTSFIVPTPYPQRDLSSYRVRWLESAMAYEVIERLGAGTIGSKPFPIQAIYESMQKRSTRERSSSNAQKWVERTDEYMYDDLVEEKSTKDDDVKDGDIENDYTEAEGVAQISARCLEDLMSTQSLVTAAHMDEDMARFMDSQSPVELDVESFGDAGYSETQSDVSSIYDPAQILHDARKFAQEIGLIVLPQLRNELTEEEAVECETSVDPELELTKPSKPSRNRREGWVSPILEILEFLRDAEEGAVNPPSSFWFDPPAFQFHHLNYNLATVFEKTSTPPEVSLWFIASQENRHFAHSPCFSRQSIVVAQAAKHIDPVFYIGPLGHLKLNGSKMREAITGQVYRCYPPMGDWGGDSRDPDEDVPCVASPGAPYWNVLNSTPAPVPYIFVEGDHQLPNINCTGAATRPFAPHKWTGWGPSPLRQQMSIASVDELDNSEATRDSDSVSELATTVVNTPELSDGTSESDSSSSEVSDMDPLLDSGSRIQSSLDGPVDEVLPDIDVENLPPLEQCNIEGLSPETLGLLNLVKSLKEQCTTSLTIDHDLKSCEPQTDREVSDDNSHVYAEDTCHKTDTTMKLMDEQDSTLEQLREISTAAPVDSPDVIARKDSHQRQGNEASPPDQIPLAINAELLALDTVKNRTTDTSPSAVNTGPTGLETPSPSNANIDSASSVASVEEARSEEKATKERPLGKWLYFGTALAFAGFYLYRRMRK